MRFDSLIIVIDPCNILPPETFFVAVNALKSFRAEALHRISPGRYGWLLNGSLVTELGVRREGRSGTSAEVHLVIDSITSGCIHRSK